MRKTKEYISDVQQKIIELHKFQVKSSQALLSFRYMCGHTVSTAAPYMQSMQSA